MMSLQRRYFIFNTKRNCAAIIVTKNYANDYLYNSEEGNLILCEQLNQFFLL